MLVGLAFTGGPGLAGLWIFLFIVHQLCTTVASTPYIAVIPDLVPRHQFGAASAYLTVMTLIGILAGAVLTGLLLEWAPGSAWAAYVLNMAFTLTGGVVVLGTLRGMPPRAQPLPPFALAVYVQETLRPFRDRSFSLVFWTRLFMITAQYLLLQFFQFFLRDVVTPYWFFTLQLPTPEQAYAFFLFISLLGSVCSGLLSGLLADRIRRKILVRVGAVLPGGGELTICAQVVVGGAVAFAPVIALTSVRDYTSIVFLGFVLGLGVGLYVTAGWAMTIDVLPSQEYARDLGVWGATSVVPQIIGAPVAGLMLDGFQSVGRTYNINNLGYIVVFVAAAALIVLGTLPILSTRERTRYPAGVNIMETLRDSLSGIGVPPTPSAPLRPLAAGDGDGLRVEALGPEPDAAARLERALGFDDSGAASLPPVASSASLSSRSSASGGSPRAPAAADAQAGSADAASGGPTMRRSMSGTGRVLPPPPAPAPIAPRRVVIRTSVPRRPALRVSDVEAMISKDETAMRSTMDM
jgi:MFS family permease